LEQLGGDFKVLPLLLIELVVKLDNIIAPGQKEINVLHAFEQSRDEWLHDPRRDCRASVGVGVGESGFRRKKASSRQVLTGFVLVVFVLQARAQPFKSHQLLLLCVFWDIEEG